MTVVDERILTDALDFEELVREHGPRLRALAHRVVRCPEIAAEVVQDVFLHLWRDRGRLEIRRHLAGYLTRAVRNRAFDRRKRHRVESRWLEHEAGELERRTWERILEGITPDDDRGHRIDAALAELPERRREVMLLRWRDGLSYGEIAERTGVSVKTVENQLGRGLKALRESLSRPS